MDKEERKDFKNKLQCALVPGPTGGEQCLVVLLWSAGSVSSWEQGVGNGKQKSPLKAQWQFKAKMALNARPIQGQLNRHSAS